MDGFPVEGGRPALNLQVEVPDSPGAPFEQFGAPLLGFQDDNFALTSSGTWKQDGMQIGRSGIMMNGRSATGLGFATPPPPQDPLRMTPPGDTSMTSRGRSNSLANDPLVDARAEDSVVDRIRLNDIQVLGVIGQGNSGIVQKVIHRPTGVILALKVIRLDLNEVSRNQLLGELRILLNIRSEYCVSFYGGFLKEGSVQILLEYMDFTLSDLLQRAGSLPEPVLAKLAFSMLKGLTYLHRTHHLIHRDIKPSNILINRRGDFKISDFGVSTQMQNSMQKCQSWVGTVTYMSPERITGKAYNHTSDIWSVGLTLLECALGKFPYFPGGGDKKSFGFWDLLEHVVKNPVPRLHPDEFSPEFCHFVGVCMNKQPEKRPSSEKLLVCGDVSKHPFILKFLKQRIDVASWIQSLMEPVKADSGPAQMEMS